MSSAGTAPSPAPRIGHTGITWPFTPAGARQAMEELAPLGYQAVELFGFVLDAYPGGMEAVRADLARTGLTLAAAYCSAPLIDPSTHDADLASMGRWAGMVRELGGEVVVVGASRRKRPVYEVQDYRYLSRTLEEVGRRCRAEGVLACFHPHTGTPVETREEIDRVMSQVDPDLVFFAPDTGQIAKGGGDPLEVVRTYRERVRHVHLKDYVGGTTQLDAGGGGVDRTGWLDYVPLGQGVVDLASIARLLEDAGYRGWWMVELDGTPEAPVPPREAAAASKQELDRLLGVRR
ncbi:MAG: TIM barrel protein [Candidatus Dormibacteraeota bacterium]|nr:TIM barrel protein [Candidatus Dormibacteraeota bacterium]